MNGRAPMKYQRLGVNIDHVATIRNARGGRHPDPVRAAHIAINAGADGITAHLREDRRHISDADIARLKNELTRPLNFEMAATDEMLEIAKRYQPHACCLVPERREERTTEGGLDVISQKMTLEPVVKALRDAGCRVSLFIEGDPAQLDVAHELEADIVELHTGRYCDLAIDGDGIAAEAELERLKAGATHAGELGLEVHAGHGLTFNTVKAIAVIPEIVELNIGHFLIGEGIFVGLDRAVAQMRSMMADARGPVIAHPNAQSMSGVA